MYRTLIKSRLQYGIVLWGNAHQSALKNLNALNAVATLVAKKAATKKLKNFKCNSYYINFW